MVTLIGIVIGVGFVYEISSFSSASASALSSVKASLSLTPGAGSVGFNGALGTLVPGDTRVTYSDLTNTGSLNTKFTTLSVMATNSTFFTTDPVKGLQIYIENCEVAWTHNLCGQGLISNVLGTLENPVPLSLLTFANSTRLKNIVGVAGAINYLKVYLSLGSVKVNNSSQISSSNSVVSTALTWIFSAS